MNRLIGLTIVAFLFTQTARANLNVTCSATGLKTSQNGAGMLATDAKISFQVEDYDPSTDKVMSIVDVNGTVKVGAIDTPNEPLTTDNAYIGNFEFEGLKSNPNYRPIKYKNMVQFKDFNAKDTTGREDGMWGSLLIDRNLSDGCDAKYIFQAGDHMGGTVHMSCRVK